MLLSVLTKKLQDKMKSKNDRIEELEEALKESVKITAEREMVMVDLQNQLDTAEKKVRRRIKRLGKGSVV